MNRTFLAVAAFLFATCLSLVDVQEWVAANFPWLSPFLPYLKWVAGILLVLLLVLTIIELVSWIFEAAARLLPSTQQNKTIRNVKFDELPEIVEIAKEHIGPDLSLEVAKQIYNHNKNAIKKVIDTRSCEIVGYFCVVPLTVKGEEKVKERDLVDGTDNLSCFAKRFTKRTPVYIGSVAGKGIRGRAATLELLKAFLISKEVSHAYARPATKHGVRLAKRYKFNAVNPHDKVELGVYVLKVAHAI
jgi:hypothetical protein